MKHFWRIRKYDSQEEVGTWDVPGHYTQTEVERILQALTCRDLNEIEIISSLRRKSDPSRAPLLDRIGNGPTLQYGENPWYTASYTGGTE